MDPIKRWYLNPEQRRSKALAIRGLAIREQMPPAFIDRPTIGDFLLMHFHDAAIVRIGGELRAVAAHTLYIWPPGSRQTFGHGAQPWLHSWIHCDGSRIRAALESAAVPLEQPLQLSGAAITEKYLRALYDEMSGFVQPDPLILEGFFALWMRELVRATRRLPRNRAIPPRLLEVRRFIDSALDQPLSLDLLANKALLSVTQFSSEFRRHFGTSPINYVLRMRMQRALHHLSDNTLNISEIAQRCGFADPFYFSKQFKQHFGKSPRAYRRDQNSSVL